MGVFLLRSCCASLLAIRDRHINALATERAAVKDHAFLYVIPGLAAEERDGWLSGLDVEPLPPPLSEKRDVAGANLATLSGAVCSAVVMGLPRSVAQPDMLPLHW